LNRHVLIRLVDQKQALMEIETTKECRRLPWAKGNGALQH